MTVVDRYARSLSQKLLQFFLMYDTDVSVAKLMISTFLLLRSPLSQVASMLDVLTLIGNTTNHQFDGAYVLMLRSLI